MNNNCLSISIKFATTNLLLTQYRLIHKYALPRTFNIILYNLHHMLNLLMQTSLRRLLFWSGEDKVEHTAGASFLFSVKNPNRIFPNFKLCHGSCCLRHGGTQG